MPYKDAAVKRAYDRARYERLKDDPEFKEKGRQQRAAWRARKLSEDPDYDRRRMVARRATDPDYFRAAVLAWRRANPDVARKHAQTRRARKLDQFIEEVDPAIVYQMHGGRCGICGEFIEGDFHVDHVIPLARGGMHGYVNVQPAHPICNMRKGDRVGG